MYENTHTHMQVPHAGWYSTNVCTSQYTLPDTETCVKSMTCNDSNAHLLCDTKLGNISARIPDFVSMSNMLSSVGHLSLSSYIYFFCFFCFIFFCIFMPLTEPGGQNSLFFLSKCRLFTHAACSDAGHFSGRLPATASSFPACHPHSDRWLQNLKLTFKAKARWR